VGSCWFYVHANKGGKEETEPRKLHYLLSSAPSRILARTSSNQTSVQPVLSRKKKMMNMTQLAYAKDALPDTIKSTLPSGMNPNSSAAA